MISARETFNTLVAGLKIRENGEGETPIELFAHDAADIARNFSLLAYRHKALQQAENS